MHYSIALSTILACFAAVNAQTPGFNPFITPSKDQNLHAGEKFEITWQPSGAPEDATVSIKLLQGSSPSTLQQGPNVGSKIPSKMGRFVWTIPRSIKSYETYGFVMFLDGKEDVFQYSFPFHLDGLDNSSNDQPARPNPKEPSGDAKPKDPAADVKPKDPAADVKPKDPAADVKPKDPAGSPKPDPLCPDDKYNNGTKGYEPKPSGMPKPSGVKPSGVKPPGSKPSAPVQSGDKTVPVTSVNGASSLTLSISALIIGTVIALAL